MSLYTREYRKPRCSSKGRVRNSKRYDYEGPLLTVREIKGYIHILNITRYPAHALMEDLEAAVRMH